ncbi:MAG: fumarylacetoacetate hydrolase family protein [Xanthomonadales bacterium]|nr:fumarylacetoacetate hydrolase family protein [Xanthomonadales bacterium]
MNAGNEQGFVLPPPRVVSLPVAGGDGRFAVRRCFCVGQNYSEHAREMGASGREPPFFFAKPADAVCTPNTLPFPGMTHNLHHEVELVVAIGAACRSVPVRQALDRVFGYAVGVDLTRRDLQAAAKEKGRPWTTAKGFDLSAPVSAIRPAADGGHPDDVPIRLSVNGGVRQDGRTGDMIWSVPEVIAELSRYFELQAGDLVFTGTPAGVGPLVPGDLVECRIDGVGELAFSLGPATY